MSDDTGHILACRVLFRYALFGLLDWKTLVAWLFYLDLTVEKSVSEVPFSRRFETTVAQTDPAQLERYVEQEQLDFGLLSSLIIEAQPFDFQDNVNFGKDAWIIREFADDDEEEYESEPEQLNRQDEDMSDLGYLDLGTYYREQVEREWRERRYWERPARRDRWLQKMRIQRRMSRTPRRSVRFV